MTQSAVLNKNMDKAALGAQLRKDGVIIRTWDLMKTYVMGDQTIHAVAGVEIGRASCRERVYGLV